VVAGGRTPDGGVACGQCGHSLTPIADTAWLNWVGEIPAELAQRIACDATVWRTVLDPASGHVLDLGRAYRIAPYWLRRALHARDKGCRWHRCERPPAWTDIHHIIAWIEGGNTNLDELLSLCRFHHRLVHEGGWSIHFNARTGKVRIWRPDGTPYELNEPPDPDDPTATLTGPPTNPVGDGTCCRKRRRKRSP
jgi:hypothetical protein